MRKFNIRYKFKGNCSAEQITARTSTDAIRQLVAKIGAQRWIVYFSVINISLV